MSIAQREPPRGGGERRLRSWWCHEAQSVHAAVVSALHHTCDVGPAKNEAPRGQKKTTEEEDAGLETHSGLRGPTLLPPRTRPEPLGEPLHWFIPGLEARCPDDRGVPSLATPSLEDAAGDAVDAVTVEFLVEWALLEPEEQERIRMAERRKRERRKKQEETQNLEVGKRKRKKKRKRKLPRTSSRPRLACSGYKFLPRSPRRFGTNSTFFLRDGGARAVRTWKPRLCASHWYLAHTCSVPVTPEEHKKIWSFLRDDCAEFFDPLYLTVTCSACAGGVQDYGLFWKMTSGWIPCPAPVGSTLDTCPRQFTDALTIQTAENCRNSAVAVLQGRRHFLHGAEADFHGLAVQQTIVVSQFAVLERGDRCPWYASRAGFSLCPLCAATGSSTRSSTPCRRAEADPHGPVCSEIVEIPQLLDAVADVPVVRSYRFSRAGCG